MASKQTRTRAHPTTTRSAAGRTRRRAAPAAARTTRRRGALGAAHTLAIDVGGTGLKAAVLDETGRMITDRVRVETPHPCTPAVLVDALLALVEPLPAFHRASVGFPGLIRHGVVRTAPNLGSEAFAGFDLAGTLAARLGVPVRAINDADMQGLAAVRGQGVEMVITLGTGFGTALFEDGRLQVHLEIAHHPFKKGKTYDQILGDRGRKRSGNRKWKKDLQEALVHLRTVVNFDRLYIGGGNARRIDFALPDDVELGDNSAGVMGGHKLWSANGAPQPT